MDTRTDHGPSVRLWYTVPIEQPTAQREFERGRVRLIVRDKEPKGDKDMLPASRLLRDLAIVYARDDLIPMSALRLLPSPKWVVKGILPEGVSLIYGDREHYKSLSVLGLALSLVLGKPWYGHEIADAGPVVYVAAERAAGFLKRIAAYEKHHDVTISDRFMLRRTPVDLMNDEEVEKFIAQVRATFPNATPKIIFDTLNRCSGDAIENSNSDMGKIMRNIDRIRWETGANLIVLIHHIGTKPGKRPRGASAVGAAVDTQIFLNKSGTVVTVECTKQSDFESFEKFKLQMKRIQVEVHGKQDTSVVLIPREETKTFRLDDKHREIYNALKEPKTNGELKKAVADKIKERTCDTKIKELEDHGYVERDPPGGGKGARYQHSAKPLL